MTEEDLLTILRIMMAVQGLLSMVILALLWKYRRWFGIRL